MYTATALVEELRAMGGEGFDAMVFCGVRGNDIKLGVYGIGKTDISHKAIILFDALLRDLPERYPVTAAAWEVLKEQIKSENAPADAATSDAELGQLSDDIIALLDAVFKGGMADDRGDPGAQY